MGIAENLALVRERIEAACRRADRNPDEVQLCAVSKFHPASAVAEAYRAGQRLFGENYAQELRDKADELSSLPDIRFHFIGRLQKNKAKYAAAAAEAVESLDSIDVAAELSRRLASRGRARMKAFVEVNFDEEQKGGVSLVSLQKLLREMEQFKNIDICGLMTIPPEGISEAETRRIFQQLAAAAHGAGLRELSMGMSHDYEIAVEEGATIVRVGTAIFGPRPLNAKPGA